MNRLIETEEDYVKALARIEVLMGASKSDTSKMDEFDKLVSLVEMYEDVHYPIDLPEPWISHGRTADQAFKGTA